MNYEYAMYVSFFSVWIWKDQEVDMLILLNEIQQEETEEWEGVVKKMKKYMQKFFDTIYSRKEMNCRLDQQEKRFND